MIREGRRVALAPADTAAGRFAFRSVTVDVHTPESMPSGEEGPGTPGLQVYPTGAAPHIAWLQVIPRPHVPKVFVLSEHGSAVIAGLVTRELAATHLPAAHFLRHEGSSA